MPPLKNVRREKFAQLLFAEPHIPDYKHYVTAGYSSNPHTCMTVATKLRNTTEIMERLAELQSEVAQDNIMSVQERKEILSEIARGNLADYRSGYNSDSPHARAVRKIVNRSRADKDGSESSESIIELDDRRAAIAELNKMDGIYQGLDIGDVADLCSVAASIWSAIADVKQQGKLPQGDKGV